MLTVILSKRVRTGPSVFHIGKKERSREGSEITTSLMGLLLLSPFFLVHPTHYHQRDPKLIYGLPPSRLKISDLFHKNMLNVTSHQEIKTTMAYYLMSVRKAIKQTNKQNRSVGKYVEKLEFLYTVDGNAKCCSHYGKQCGASHFQQSEI